MFNEEVKIRYINEVITENSRYAEIRFFEKVKIVEEKYGVDVALVEKIVLEEEFSGMFSSSKSYFDSSISKVRRYVKWRIKNGLDANEDILKKKEVSVKKSTTKTKFVSSPKHLYSALNSYGYIEGAHNNDSLHRLFNWMLFSGIKQDDITLIKKSDVDRENLTVNINGKSYDLYKECIKDLDTALSVEYFIYQNPLYKEKPEMLRKRISDEYLFSGIRSEKLKRKDFSEISRKNEMLTGIKEMSFTHVTLSGIFYRTKELEQMGLEPDFTELSYNRILDSKKEHPTEEQVANNAKNILREYRFWKEAFNVICDW